MSKNDILKEEIDYLNKCKDIINNKIVSNDSRIKEIVDSIDSSLYDYFNGDVKKATDEAHIIHSDDFVQLSRELLNEKSHLSLLVKENTYLEKMKGIPYFSRINFNDDSYYIGISSLFNDNNDLMIVDWRAPIADLYYESMIGDTYYKLENGKLIKGNLSLKRQFIIENGHLVDYIDNDLKIDDPILIKELAKSSSDKLKNIVSTIQVEQNKAIKADIYNDLLVLGVAGSGKTSVAMHRISYLIYRNSKIYNSNKIAVLSPNSYFYNYIDNILPSLGENNVMNFDITFLIEKALKKCNKNFKNKERFYIDLFNDYNLNKINIPKSKSLDDFISKEIKYYIKDINIKFYSFENSYKEICEYFSSNIKNKRLGEVIEDYHEFIINKVHKDYFKPDKKEINGLLYDIKHMFYKIDCFAILNKFLTNKYKENDALDYYDAVSLAYIVLKIYRIKDLDNYNHLVIDEIQDYSSVEMAIINMLFSCKKTMVGDLNQILSDKFDYNFKDCNKLELLNSYRSSKEIFDFINSIVPSNKSVSVMRHGNKPIINKCNDFKDEINKVIELLNSSEGTSAVICKNSKECSRWYKVLKDKINIKRVNDKCVSNVIISTIYECKGLEFDNVIIVDTDSNNYKCDIENNWLYIACSRAMHNLNLFYYGQITKFINKIDEEYYLVK